MTKLRWDELYEIIIKQGFVDAGWSPCEAVEFQVEKNYRDWLEAGYHADMHYLERNLDKRLNPGLLMDNVRFIITMIYPWPVQEPVEGKVKISGYALGLDYHFFLREKAKPVMQFIKKKTGHESRFFTDSAPVMDRYWAWKAGLGFIGKNGQLIHPLYGSRIFIAHIFTPANIEGNRRKPIPQACGTCKRCIEACPTLAIVKPFVIDSNRCIAYWTIEAKKDIPAFILKKNDGWVFGCDICTDVCPYNYKKTILSWENNQIYEWFRKGMFLEIMKARKFTPMNRTSMKRTLKLFNYYIHDVL